MSVPLNIAEGSGRSKKDFCRFLDISRTSCSECIAILEVAKNLEILDDTQLKEIKEELIMLSKMINRLKIAISHNS